MGYFGPMNSTSARIVDCVRDVRPQEYEYAFSLKQWCYQAYRMDVYEKLEQLSKKFEQEALCRTDAGKTDTSIKPDVHTPSIESSILPDSPSFSGLSSPADRSEIGGSLHIHKKGDLARYLHSTPKAKAIEHLGSEEIYDFLVDSLWTMACYTSPTRHTVDKVYGQIYFPKHFWRAVIDSVAVQRQRTVSQAGGAMYTFPTATQTRFEHALGVGHLAGEFFDLLRLKSGDLSRSRRVESLRMAVMIAGVCHDIGHGPYSHAFETFAHDHLGCKDWSHERMSVQIVEMMAREDVAFAKLLKDYDIKVEDIAGRILGDYDLEDLENLNPDDNCSGNDEKILAVEDRLEVASRYIVCNKYTGIDVDRLDYLVRDLLIAPKELPGPIKVRRIMAHAALGRNGMIVFSEKVKDNIFDMLDSRRDMYKNIYTHPCNMQFECMQRDILGYVSDLYGIKEALSNPATFINLNEHLLSIWALEPNIRNHMATAKRPIFSADRLKKVMYLIHRFKIRDPYKTVLQIIIDNTDEGTKIFQLLRDSESLLSFRDIENGPRLRINPKNLHICTTSLTTGTQDMFKHLQFYKRYADSHEPLSAAEQAGLANRWNYRSIIIITSKYRDGLREILEQCVQTAIESVRLGVEPVWYPAPTSPHHEGGGDDHHDDRDSDDSSVEDPDYEYDPVRQFDYDIGSPRCKHHHDEDDCHEDLRNLTPQQFIKYNYSISEERGGALGAVRGRRRRSSSTPKSKIDCRSPPFYNNK